jgi:hypothetical protein
MIDELNGRLTKFSLNREYKKVGFDFDIEQDNAEQVEAQVSKLAVFDKYVIEQLYTQAVIIKELSNKKNLSEESKVIVFSQYTFTKSEYNSVMVDDGSNRQLISVTQKAIIFNKYVLKQLEDDSILIGEISDRQCNNVKGTLREIARTIGFEYDPKWNTHQFGSKMIDELNGKTTRFSLNRELTSDVFDNNNFDNKFFNKANRECGRISFNQKQEHNNAIKKAAIFNKYVIKQDNQTITVEEVVAEKHLSDIHTELFDKFVIKKIEDGSIIVKSNMNEEQCILRDNNIQMMPTVAIIDEYVIRMEGESIIIGETRKKTTALKTLKEIASTIRISGYASSSMANTQFLGDKLIENLSRTQKVIVFK